MPFFASQRHGILGKRDSWMRWTSTMDGVVFINNKNRFQPVHLPAQQIAEFTKSTVQQLNGGLS